MDFNSEAEVFRNVIICSYKRYRALKARYPRKKVMPDQSCPNSWFYFITKNGQVRHYDALTGCLYDHCIGDFTSAMIKTRFLVKV